MGSPLLPFTPVPIVDFRDIDLPQNGAFITRTEFCTRKFAQGDTCKDFYKRLALSPETGKAVQCPFGFTCFPFDLGGVRHAFTGFIASPRLGGDNERQRAKDFPHAKIDIARIEHFASELSKGEKARIASLSADAKNYPHALHEIRKLNRNVKHEAERLLLGGVQEATSLVVPLTNIVKSTELMTYQFEILDLLANETLAVLERRTQSDVYKMVDKCVRIYEIMGSEKTVDINLGGDGLANPPIIATVCDKTFPIIPTVLIENAIKHATPETTIIVRVKREKPELFKFSVTNWGPRMTVALDLLKKGVTGGLKSSGQGFGLYLANVVAGQHEAKLRYTIKAGAGKDDQYSFVLTMGCRPPNADSRRK